MKHPFILLFAASLVLSLNQIVTFANEVTIPQRAGGFVLNSSIDDYQINDRGNYLHEAIVTDLKGFRKGFITYGTCQASGKILRIKLKYEDRSASFFDKLLNRYREKFGDNPRFEGDPFGNVKSWKWSFTDEQGQRITLELQHNLRDADESIGNMVKLSMPELLNEERRCFNQRNEINDETAQDSSGGESTIDWELLMPD